MGFRISRGPSGQVRSGQVRSGLVWFGLSNSTSQVGLPVGHGSHPRWPWFIRQTRLRKTTEERYRLLASVLNLNEVRYLVGEPSLPMIMQVDHRHLLQKLPLFRMRGSPSGVDARPLRCSAQEMSNSFTFPFRNRSLPARTAQSSPDVYRCVSKTNAGSRGPSLASPHFRCLAPKYGIS